MRPLTRLASLVPEEEYIHRAPYGAAEAFGLHDLYHAQKDTLQQRSEEHTSELQSQ